MPEIAKIIDRKLQYPCLCNFTSYQQQDIAKMFHDHKTTGHPGELETYNVI